MNEINSSVAGWLRDLAFVQASPHSRWGYKRAAAAVPRSNFLSRAAASGCLFAVDSDAHAADQWWYAETALARARLAGIPRARVINGWPLDRLLRWAGAKSGSTTSRSAESPD